MPAHGPGQAGAHGQAQEPAQGNVLAPAQTPGHMGGQAAPLTAAQGSAPSPGTAPRPFPAEDTASWGTTEPGRGPADMMAGPGGMGAAPLEHARRPAHPEDPRQGPPGAATPKDGVSSYGRTPLPPRLVWRLGTGAARMAADTPDGWQTWRFLPDKRLNRFYPAGTWTITATAKGANGRTVTQYASFELKRETKLSAVRAEKSARADGVRLRGSLTRVDPRGLTDYGPFGKQRLEVLWRPDASSAWTRVGETTTDAAGAFVGTVKGRTGGYWRVRFPGTGHYAANVSKVRQIVQ
ncbi:hypothetical protein [Nonomuraea candida]|uniref:hypothetical protein n=1 Tax=Nonomuraea candida TaxID=359159 RepID=UPI0005B98451|nr:hypothetical protein [Nonomuraea candida]